MVSSEPRCPHCGTEYGEPLTTHRCRACGTAFTIEAVIRFITEPVRP